MLGTSQPPETSAGSEPAQQPLPDAPVVRNPLRRLFLPGLLRLVIASLVLGGLTAFFLDILKAQENYRSFIRPAFNPNVQIPRPWTPYTPPVWHHVPPTWPQPHIPIFQPHIPSMQPSMPARRSRR
jgi:hypothetical protein